MSSIDFREYQAAFYSQNDLYHFGILGMKWGVRRYQNPDGSLTQEGLRRYRYDPYKQKYTKLNKNERMSNDKLMDKGVNPYNPNDDKKLQLANKEKLRAFRADQAIKEMEESGWKKREYGSSISKTDGKNNFDLYWDRSNGSIQDSKETYKNFKKEEKEHMNNIKQQMLKEIKNEYSHWHDSSDKTLSSMKNDLENGNFWITIDGKAIDIMSDAIEELGYHSIIGSYDIKTKKMTRFGLEG